MPDNAPKRNGKWIFIASFLSGRVREWHRVPPPCHALTQDVPANALALGRSRQVVKQGWAARLRGLKAVSKKKV
jgi:hypothetical protein